MSTYVPIQAITLSASATSITFTGIPQTYTDLVIVANAGAVTNNVPGLQLRFNGDTSSLYSTTRVNGNGSLAQSARNSNSTVIEGGNYSTGFPTFANGGFVWTCNVMNYSNTTTNKTVVARFSAATTDAGAMTGLYRSTSAITSITLLVTSDNFASGSTFTLYGVGTGSPKAFGGDEVRTDGTYWYHIFNSSGRFEPVESLTNVDYLVVAGGGAGGAGYLGGCGGGGGAGGYRTSAGTSGGNSAAESKLSLVANTAYTITVGAGGTSNSGPGRGGSGSSSSIGSLVVSDGGGGGGVQGGTSTGANGGSGGGAAFSVSAGGTASTNQGSNGGSTSSGGRTAGGGGAGAVGVSTAATTTRADGGGGIASSITGTSVTRAGGGGGSVNDGNASGVGGSGGGGNGASYNTNNAVAGTANTGGGGGGSNGVGGGTTAGANGGSGIVIIRYAV